MTKRNVIEDSDDEENAEATPPHPSATGLSDITLSTLVSLDGSPSHKIQDQSADPSTSSTELFNRESRAAHRSLIEPTPKSTLPATRAHDVSSQQTPTSPTTSRLKTKRSKTSVEKPKAKRPLKTYGRSSQDMFEFYGGSDGELDLTPRIDLGHNAGRRDRHGNSKIAETVGSQSAQDEKVTRRPITSSGGDTEMLSTEPKPYQSTEPKPYQSSMTGDVHVSLQSSMPPPPSKMTSFEQTQWSETSTVPTISNPTPQNPTMSNSLPPAGATCFETHSDDQMPTPTRSLRGAVDDGRSPGFVQSGNLHPMRSKEEMKATDLQPREEPAPSSSASDISPSKTITVKRTSHTKNVSQESSLHFDDAHLRPQLESDTSTRVNPVVLLSAPPDTGEGHDELSLSIPEQPIKSPTKSAKGSKRKRTNEEGAVDQLGSDDNAIGVPKEQYKPRPSKRRSGNGDVELVVPTDFSKKPEATGKVKHKTKRHKTTAFQELLPQAEDEDEEVKLTPDPRFEIPEKRTSKISTGRDEADVDRKDDAEEIRAEAQPEPKPAAKATGQKKRGRPKKVVTNLSEEDIVDEAEADDDQEDVEAEEPVVSATAKKSRKRTQTKGTSKPIIEEEERNNDGTPVARDDSEDLPGNILNETHGNIIASELATKPLPETSPTKANPPPETPRKSATPAPKGPDKHSPISSGKVAYRVGLSKRARIAPLLRIVRK
ncbi:hypothetical protein HO173_005791 [Letharia columbiana]|uniref:Uncharacterized protein n=1 Tax=Letharia columbiana TaxID=112416 RepID=A0A8H6FWS1_9LECA|nr:uncharacterized protein HO173_005791 [Letharia columbiana]KAF6236162.1 hypothetical protein HO173_005791 [Letharia columbiana]